MGANLFRPSIEGPKVLGMVLKVALSRAEEAKGHPGTTHQESPNTDVLAVAACLLNEL